MGGASRAVECASDGHYLITISSLVGELAMPQFECSMAMMLDPVRWTRSICPLWNSIATESQAQQASDRSSLSFLPQPCACVHRQ